MGKKERRVAGGAEIGHPDALRKETGMEQLKAVRQGQVKHPSAPRSAPLEKDLPIRIMTHGLMHGGINLITAGSDGRPDEGEKIGGASAEPPDHFLYCFFCNMQDGALPTGMNGADDLPYRICKENRYTVGRFDAEGGTWPVGHNGVECRRVFHIQRLPAINTPYSVLMDLVHQQKLRDGNPESRRNPFEIPTDMILVVPLAGAYIQTGKGPSADAALPCAEGMNHKIHPICGAARQILYRLLLGDAELSR